MRKGPGKRRFPRDWTRFSTFLLLACAAFGVPLRAEAPVFPPGSRLGLTPPAGLDISPDFTGFMDREAITSIVINVMPKQAFDDMATGMTADRFAARGMRLLGPCYNVTTAFESRCYRVTQEAGGYLFRKWLLIAKLETETAMVVATVPE